MPNNLIFGRGSKTRQFGASQGRAGPIASPSPALTHQPAASSQCFGLPFMFPIDSFHRQITIS